MTVFSLADRYSPPPFQAFLKFEEMCSSWLNKHFGDKITEFYSAVPEPIMKDWFGRCVKHFEVLKPKISQNYAVQVKLAFWLSLLVAQNVGDKEKEDLMLQCWKRVMELSEHYDKTFADFCKQTQQLKNWHTLSKHNNAFVVYALESFNLKEKDFIDVFEYFQPDWTDATFVHQLAEAIGKGFYFIFTLITKICRN